MPFRVTTALLVMISGTAAWAAPAPEWFLADGVVKVGTLDSAIGDYGFMTRSAMGAKIFAACKMDDLCEAKITANADEFMTRVDRVRKVGPFVTPRDLIDFIYSHYVGWSTRGFTATKEMVGKLYSPRFAALVSAADAKAVKEQEESPAASPWMDAQEWKLAGYTIAVADRGPGKARATATFTNLDAPGAKPETFTFDVVDGGSGWLIDDVVSKNPVSGHDEALTAYLRNYVKPVAAPVGAPAKTTEPSVVANAAVGTLPHLSKGTHYSQAREQLMALGYKGVKTPGADTCDASSSTTCFPEMESCAGTGEGNCLYV